MGDQQGLSRLMASPMAYRVLVLIIIVTAVLVLAHPLVKRDPSGPSSDMSLQAIRKEFLSENSELGQYLVRMVERKIRPNSLVHRSETIKSQDMSKTGGETKKSQDTSKIGGETKKSQDTSDIGGETKKSQDTSKIGGDTKGKSKREEMIKLASTVAAVDGKVLRFDDLPPLDEKWSKILHFVQQKNNDNCLRMFTTETSKDIKITPEWQKLRDAAHIEQFAGGYTPQHDKLTMLYQELARQKFVKTVCEIGFNVGQSAVAWMSSKPGIKYYGFEITGSHQMMANLKKLYPGNFNMTLGDSTKTVPEWIPKGVKCDILSIDGGHEYPIVIKDIRNIRPAAADEHIIVLDDVYYPGVNKAWKEVIASGEVESLFDCWVPGMDVDVAIGYYKKQE